MTLGIYPQQQKLLSEDSIVLLEILVAGGCLIVEYYSGLFAWTWHQKRVLGKYCWTIPLVWQKDGRTIKIVRTWQTKVLMSEKTWNWRMPKYIVWERPARRTAQFRKFTLSEFLNRWDGEAKLTPQKYFHNSASDLVLAPTTWQSKIISVIFSGERLTQPQWKNNRSYAWI